MKLICHLIAIVFLGLAAGKTALARGGDLVNNGGGIAEKNIVYAYEKLDKYIQLCLKAEACKLNESQKTLLNRILLNLPQEKQSAQLLFSSERKAPGTFIIDRLVRVAKTGLSVGSPIYINSDLLYSKNEAGGYDPISLPEAVAILVHELGHHAGNHTHEDLDLLGVRVSMLLQQKFILTPLIPWNSEVSASVLNSGAPSSYPEILLNVGDDIFDISKLYEQSVRCYALTIPIPVLPIRDVQLNDKKPAGSLLHNVHWDRLSEKSGVLRARIIGNVSNNCVFKSDIWLRNNDYKLKIDFKAVKVNGKYRIDKESIEMEQYREPWYKIIRLPLNPLD